jgi:Fic family protein
MAMAGSLGRSRTWLWLAPMAAEIGSTACPRKLNRNERATTRSFERQQRSDLDVTGWLDWFLDCLDKAIANSEEALAAVHYKSRLWKRANRWSVNERQRQVLNRMLDGFEGHLSTSKYAKLAKCSTDTALRDIRELLDRGFLIQNPGAGRSTSYRLPMSEELEHDGMAD